MHESVAICARHLSIAAHWFVLLMVIALPLWADVHPVPLDKNTDSAKCIECHSDKTAGKAVHTAIAAGCMTCHEIRINKDVTRVKLITTTTYGLCFTCHTDKNPAEIKGTLHKPAMRDCVKCHDPHSSDNQYQLLKPPSGDQKENLCLTCHPTGLNVPAKGSRHPALDMGCETCHLTHKTGGAGNVEFDFHLTKSAPTLCLDCHDPKNEDLQKAHNGQPFEIANCLACHDPHQSSSPNLMRPFMHPPFADKSCEICHAPAKDGKVVLTQPDVKSLCVTCHDEQVKQIESAKVQHPGAMSDCTDCHSPHSSRQPGLPKTNAVEICLTCHTDQAEMAKAKKVLHRPAFQDGCATCHDAHGNDNDHLFRVKDVNTLCLECHGPDTVPERLESRHMIAIFDGKVELPEKYPVPILPLKYNAGHPVDFHPVAGPVDPKNPAGEQMNCLTCHQAHAGNQVGMLVKDQKPNMDFCNTCHKGRLN
ncbi:MAG TPA: cytochrome c3 family protein [Candidatus Sulfotelmatobacter sp.]|nr:cytochrome c3 family protein [Candidatus Sulfotelmatobacter sp.]